MWFLIFYCTSTFVADRSAISPFLGGTFHRKPPRVHANCQLGDQPSDNLNPVTHKVQSIPLGVTFSKAQSSKLEHLFYHVSVKRDVRPVIFEF